MRHSKNYESLEDEVLPEDGAIDEIIEEVEKEEHLHQTGKHKNARKSVEEYLENKRIKRQYRDLFSDDLDIDRE